MAANEYVKAAASQLQNAATAVKTEIDQMRADLMTYEREVQKDIDNKQMDIHADNAKRAADQPDATDAALMMKVKLTEKYVDEKKDELARHKAEVANAMREKENAMQELKTQANGLQSQAANYK